MDVYPGGALYPVLDTCEAVGGRVTEMGQDCPGYSTDVIPELKLNQIPFGFDNWDRDWWVLWYWTDYGSIYDSLYAEQNVKAYFWLAEPEPIWSTKPLRTIADFDGLRMRTIGASAEYFTKYLGVATTALPPPEIYTALQTHTVDAAEWGGGGQDYEAGIHEVAKYGILPEYLEGYPNHTLINMDAYNELPDDLKVLVDYLLKHAGANYMKYELLESSMRGRVGMAQEGLEWIYLNDDDVKQLRQWGLEFRKEAMAEIGTPEALKLIGLWEEMYNKVKLLP